MPVPTNPSPAAEDLFADWLAGEDDHDLEGLERLCREHPDQAEGLRTLGTEWARIHSILGRVGTEEANEARAELLSHLVRCGETTWRYRVEGEIGRGSMGAVLRVLDENLRRTLAMKVALGRYGTADSSGESREGGTELSARQLARFLEEAEVTSQLDHPGIVPVHELGLDADGRVYFTMKLVEGSTLKEVLDELANGTGEWTRERILGVILKICEAMSFAHDNGVVHRDLKPSNVMVGRYGEVFVMDWGLARILDRPDEKDLRLRVEPATMEAEEGAAAETSRSSSPDSPLITMDGDVLGTPAYMPPEQADGRIDEIGPPSDVYAVGSILYHLLAGNMPHVAPGEQPTGQAVWFRVRTGPPRPLSETVPAAPAELIAICEKAMARDWRDRYPDMSGLAADLSAYLEHRVVRAYRTGAWTEAKKWVERNRPLAAALAAALLLLVIGLVSSLALKAQSETHAALARAETVKVLRLSDVKRLQQLEADADELWPAHPDRIPDLESWLGQARPLLGNLDGHRATLAEMHARATPSSEEMEPRQTWSFETSEEGWQHDVLQELVADLEQLEAGPAAEDVITGKRGWSVPRRLAFARQLQAGFAPGGDYARAWAEASPAIAAAYPGLELKPQMGLVPIGPDPHSGLWEFAHLMTGQPPARDSFDELMLAEDLCIVLVLLPGGEFWMGAQKDDPQGRNYDPQAQRDEGPVHRVELSPFFLSKFELTQGQWMQLAGEEGNPSTYYPGNLGATRRSPVEALSWLDATAWLDQAGLQLPSEAQWEYGARGGMNTPWWTGRERESLREKRAANLLDQTAARMGAKWAMLRDWPEFDDGWGAHAPVGSFAANPFGLHEVTGNVRELCLDELRYEFYARSPKLDPVATGEPDAEFVSRGGSFSYEASWARSSDRNGAEQGYVDHDLGFRPARAIER